MFLLATALALAVGCAGQVRPDEPTERGAASTGTTKTLVMATKVEPASLASKSLTESGATLNLAKRPFNADLTTTDPQGHVLPYLAESLPELNTPSWQVFPDGRMETTYRLNPQLFWHDGHPLTGADFILSWRVFTDPALGTSGSVPYNLLESVEAPDDRTIVIRWKRPYPDAGILGANFPPLPAHILEEPHRHGPPEAFASHPYWTREFIGLGPYRVDRWEPGAFVDGLAFDRHVWGRPKIDRVHLVFISDPNTALANLLAGQLQLAADDAIRFEQATTLKREWGSVGGSVLITPTLYRAASFQLRPHLATPSALLDVRVRKALAYALDKQALNESLFEGQGVMADLPIPPGAPYWAEIQRTVELYPYDLQKSQQLMSDAGYTLGGDNVYRGSAGPLNFSVMTTASSQNQQEMAVVAAGWRRAGFAFQESVLPAAQAQDNEARSTFPSLYIFSTGNGEATLAGYVTARIPSPENRWNGQNRGGWSNKEFDDLASRFNSSLDRRERDQLVVRMAQIFNAELPAASMSFVPTVVAHSAALRGPQPYVSGGSFSANIVEWELH